MRLQPFLALCVACSAQLTFADELLYRYEADMLPYDPSQGWLIFDPCDQACSEGLEPGYLALEWGPFGGERFVNYTYGVAFAPTQPPPPPFWAEWRFASNFPATHSTSEDGAMHLGYYAVGVLINMYGDSIFDFFADHYVTGLELNKFRTFRLEATSQSDYCIWYDGILFTCAAGGQTNHNEAYLQIFGHGGDDPNFHWPVVNRWDYVRYGRVTTGEVVVGSAPPSGTLNATLGLNFDRFTVTFDQPNYVYVNDVTVEVAANQYRDRQGAVSAADAPVVIATRRLDNGPPETIEIVLDRPLTVADGTVRFTFNTGAATPQTVEYTLTQFEPCCMSGGQCQSLAPQNCADQGGSAATSSCEGDLDHDGRDGACGDACPTDPVKFLPGQCGCGIADTDSDSDTAPDCLDQCPGQDDRIDSNADGIPDCLSQAIPTASAWGLAILTLLLLIAAKVVQVASAPLPRRRRA